MLFMVVEKFRNQDGKAVYRKLRDEGRGLPDGLKFVASYVSADLGRCFQLMEADDVTLFLNPTGSRVIWGGPEDAALKARVLSALIANYPLGSVSLYDVSAPNSAVVA